MYLPKVASMEQVHGQSSRPVQALYCIRSGLHTGHEPWNVCSGVKRAMAWIEAFHSVLPPANLVWSQYKYRLSVAFDPSHFSTAVSSTVSCQYSQRPVYLRTPCRSSSFDLPVLRLNRRRSKATQERNKSKTSFLTLTLRLAISWKTTGPRPFLWNLAMMSRFATTIPSECPPLLLSLASLSCLHWSQYLFFVKSCWC